MYANSLIRYTEYYIEYNVYKHTGCEVGTPTFGPRDKYFMHSGGVFRFASRKYINPEIKVLRNGKMPTKKR